MRGGSLVEEITPLGTSSFHLSATREFDNGHRLRLSVAQPLRVEDGAVEFSLPTGRTPEGVVTGRRFSAPLAPSGRQLDLTTAWSLPLAGGDLSLAVTRSGQPQHQRHAPAEWLAFAAYRATW